MLVERSPVLLEIAVSLDKIVNENSLFEPSLADARACLDAGAAIVHFHQDYCLPPEEQVQQILRMHRAIRESHPDALMFAAPIATPMAGSPSVWEVHAHNIALAEAGLLTMMDVQTGRTVFHIHDDDGMPVKEWVTGHPDSEMIELMRFGREQQAALVLAMFNPAQMYLIHDYAARGLLPRGSVLKIWFGGRYRFGTDQIPGVAVALKPTVKALEAYVEAMEGMDLPWFVAATGDDILSTPVARRALELGGHLRIGIEDVSGATRMGNLELVEAAKALAASVGREVISGSRALDFLGVRFGQIAGV